MFNMSKEYFSVHDWMKEEMDKLVEEKTKEVNYNEGKIEELK